MALSEVQMFDEVLKLLTMFFCKKSVQPSQAFCTYGIGKYLESGFSDGRFEIICNPYLSYSG